jgi:hypothetical protein
MPYGIRLSINYSTCFMLQIQVCILLKISFHALCAVRSLNIFIIGTVINSWNPLSIHVLFQEYSMLELITTIETTVP